MSTSQNTPVPATVQAISWGISTGTVTVLVDGSVTPVPAYPLNDAAYNVGDRVLVQSWASGSNTPSQTYIIGRAANPTPTSSVIYYERYILNTLTSTATGSWQILKPSGLYGTTSVNSFGVVPYGSDGYFRAPIAGLYRVGFFAQTGNVSQTYNAAAGIWDVSANFLAQTQGPSSTWNNQWGAALSTDVPLGAGDLIAFGIVTDKSGVVFNGVTYSGWPNAGLASFTLLSTLP